MRERPLGRVLITGATGAVGPLVVRVFHNEGYRIRTLSLDSPPPGIFPDDVDALIGDITDESVVAAAMNSVDLVIHLAALLHVVNPPPELEETYEKVNVGGTAVVVDAAQRAGVRRVILFSTIAVYGLSDGVVLTEDSPARPRTFYARTKLAAEDRVLSARRDDGAVLGTVLRLGAVYGARVKGNYYRLVCSLAKGRFVPVGQGLNRRTLIHEQDVARAALLAAEHKEAAGKIYNITDGQFHKVRDITEAVCDALGRRYPSITLPLPPVRVMAGLMEDSARLLKISPRITREMLDIYTEDIAVDGKRFHRELGFVPLFDLKSGWHGAVAEMQKNGDLRAL